MITMGGTPPLPIGLPPIAPAILPTRLPQRMPRPDYTRPAYAERFRCIGSACEETCCTSWGVPIDQGTYEKYRSVESMKPHLGTLIVLNTNRPTTADYARIPLTTGAACPFLDAERLCGIQKQHGAGMLSTTCATYPRSLSESAGEREAALNLSCPEAARLTLLDPGLLGKAPAWGVPGHERYNAVRGLAGDALAEAHEPLLAIREFALLLVTDRGYALWQRMYLLGILARRLEASSGAATVAAWSAANPRKVTHLLEDSARSAVLGRLRPAMNELIAQPAEQLQLVMEILRRRVSEPLVSPRFRECVADFELGLGCAAATSEAEILGAYAENYRCFYSPLMSAHPHLIENMLVNHIFKNQYPFGKASSLDAEDETMVLCLHLALVQTMLIGMAGRYREAFAIDHVVKLVQSVARAFEHGTGSRAQMIELVRTMSLKSPRGIALLLQQA